jgi:hypothetical protein
VAFPSRGRAEDKAAVAWVVRGGQEGQVARSGR